MFAFFTSLLAHASYFDASPWPEIRKKRIAVLLPKADKKQ
jgi:hypothetical protein